jgi:hypothetical protein
MARKQFETRAEGTARKHASEAAAYRHINALRAALESGESSIARVTVMVDEKDGAGFTLYERIDLTKPY